MHCILNFILLETFELNVEAGSFTDSEIIVMLGENGRSCFVNLFSIYQDVFYKISLNLLSFKELEKQLLFEC